MNFMENFTSRPWAISPSGPIWSPVTWQSPWHPTLRRWEIAGKSPGESICSDHPTKFVTANGIKWDLNWIIELNDHGFNGWFDRSLQPWLSTWCLGFCQTWCEYSRWTTRHWSISTWICRRNLSNSTNKIFPIGKSTMRIYWEQVFFGGTPQAKIQVDPSSTRLANGQVRLNGVAMEFVGL